MRKKARFSILRFLLFCLLITAASAYMYYNNRMEAVAGEGSDFKEIVIPKGSTVRSISKILKDENMIKDSFVFELYCKVNEKSDKIKAGK